jgi:hypothetical protein
MTVAIGNAPTVNGRHKVTKAFRHVSNAGGRGKLCDPRLLAFRPGQKIAKLAQERTRRGGWRIVRYGRAVGLNGVVRNVVPIMGRLQRPGRRAQSARPLSVVRLNRLRIAPIAFGRPAFDLARELLL